MMDIPYNSGDKRGKSLDVAREFVFSILELYVQNSNFWALNYLFDYWINSIYIYI